MARNDIVLIKVEDRKQFPMPFGLLYVASALKRGNFNPWIFHIYQKQIEGILTKIREINPLMVGFSTLTGPHLLPTLKLSKMVKELGYPVVWGGVHATILTELCLREEFVDFVVRREGEETLLELAEHLKEGDNNFSEIKGIAYKEDEEIKVNPDREFIKNLDQYEIPWELIDVKNYISSQFGRKRVLPMVTSRGCPFRCGFCYNLTFNKSKWRGHSPEFVKEQAAFLKSRFDLDGVFFYDDYLFARKKRGREIIDAIELPWFGEVRADIVSEDFTAWLKESLCQRLFIGVESGSQKVLDHIQKDLTTQQIEQAIYLLSNIGIEVDMSFIIGTPGETEEDRMKTYGFIDKLQRIHPKSTASLKIYTPYPGTPLWKETLDRGFKAPKSTLSWAKIDRERCYLPWLNAQKTETVSLIAQYALANIPDTFSMGRRFIAPLAKLRWRRRFFKFPLEIEVIKWGKRMLSRIW